MNMPQHNTISHETYYNNQMQSLQQSFKKIEQGSRKAENRQIFKNASQNI
jgi:hypothetical protein